MEISRAIRLIEKALASSGTKQVWADLGAGGGLFTNALATLLEPGSTVYAIDKDQNAINNLNWSVPGVVLKKMVIDISKSKQFNLEPLDGVLMANSFHYIKDKTVFIRKLIAGLKPSGKIILVEYDTDHSNHWVPYPVSFTSLQKFADQNGISSPVRLGETPSRYGQGNIYAALLSF